jgi:hypothetical protein
MEHGLHRVPKLYLKQCTPGKIYYGYGYGYGYG